MSENNKHRPTIALLIPNVYRANEELMWRSAMDAARENGANLICFTGGYLDIPDGFEAQANILYKLISQEKIDGLVIFSSTVGWFIGKEKVVDFCKAYEPLPVVSVDANLPGIPSVVKSNYQGMREAMIHLIETHEYRRIAFLCGPEKAEWAQERLRAYTETLADYGLEVDEKLIVPTPTTWEFAGPKIGPATQQINILLNERNLGAGLDFEALVGATDSLIQEAMRTLQERGIQIPEQVAVTGFDDEPTSGVITPPLTTVQNPVGQLGRQGVELLLARLKGEDVPAEVVLASELVVRQSCGCQSQALGKVVADLEDSEVSAIDLTTRRKTVVTELGRILGTNDGAQQLWDGFTAALEDRRSSPFLAILAEILPQRIATEKDVTMWQNALSMLRRHVWPVLVDRQDLLWAENLWQQGRILVGELASRTKEYRNLLDERQMGILSEISQNLSTTFDVAGLMDILAQELPQVDIPSCYVSLYQEPQNPATWSQLMLAYNENGRIEPESKGQRFPSTHLAPAELLPQGRQYSMIVEPLYFRENQLGFALFEVGPRKGNIYETLRRQMSSSLNGAFLVEQVAKRSRQLQTVAEVSTEASAMVSDTTILLQKVVDLTKKSFGLYHAHIYLLNRAEDALVLAAGAGKVGRQMVANGWQIPLDAEQSLVAQSAQTRQGRMVNNVRDNPNWLPNPLLPDTCSELAVPLIAGERLVGVLDVQSDKINHFTEDDIQIQSTLAAQIAVALENARLFERVDQANAEIKVLNERLQEENVRMMAELNVAQQLQEMLLPKPEELQQIEGMDIAGYMKPADEVGGDYYDVLEHNGRVKIGIGDVTGHGLESGVVMLMLQTAVRTLLTSDITDPIQFMDILNRTIHKNIQRMNVTKSLSLALVDYAADSSGQVGQIRLSGQHEQLIVVRNGGHIELQDTSDLGFPVGLIANIGEFVNELPLNLQPGDGIVLYSDGITEAENEAGGFYGLERLCQVISQHWTQSAEAIKQAVVDDVQAYIGEHIVYDDITLLVIKQK